jgi:hypothetical protein
MDASCRCGDAEWPLSRDSIACYAGLVGPWQPSSDGLPLGSETSVAALSLDPFVQIWFANKGAECDGTRARVSHRTTAMFPLTFHG